ncbi:UbiD decarboxylyase family [Acididesulfobacillus acetoxydans]|uniref:4-hydroxybenzoate decarboxylase subunit C n=1 Tax=Acididesulfobacillus acetoxydans TaxID=1561005 RepID=A0A8S0WPC2_9FIRM|nr:UbiD family decarboxylase [Acididesulfobacillus acetoxydans]CAA7601824.1 UbiD decarboxylyase family [Acididesulfobacillus acetoxydans]CEJ09340.1 4-hydroxybenzoate decarboxylase subunit C [Acididesulfobacillus acetoxydans]
MFPDLRTFIQKLRQEKLLLEIEAEVDPYLELAEIHRRVIESGGPALLFTKVKGSDYPVVTNLFGTRQRVDLAMGPQPERLLGRAAASLPNLLLPKLPRLWAERKWLFPLTRVGLRNVAPVKAPVLQVKEDRVDLRRLPVLTSWPGDGGPFVTLPLVYTEHPRTHEHNLGMYRIQIKDAALTGMHWQIHKGGGFHYYEAEHLGEDLPVTLFLGGPPALILAAIAPLPEFIPELLFTSFLMGGKLERVRVQGCPHALIAQAEFAICGRVPARVRQAEGPFGDHYGYYSLQHDFPVFQAERVYHRRDAVYPATVVGKPRQEDYFIGEYLQALLAPLFPLVMPGVKALWTYAETGFHSLAAAIVRESYAREALTSAFRILGEGQLTLTKFLLLTDVELDLRDFKAVLEHILARFRPETDFILIPHTSMDTLDYTGRTFNQGSKAVMLGLGEAERRLASDYAGGPIPGIMRVESFCAGCLLLQGDTYAAAPALPEDLLAWLGRSPAERFSAWPLLVLVDDLLLAQSQTGFLWQVFTRFDPAQDIYAQTEVRQSLPVRRGPLLIDARMKPWYPGEVEADPETVKLVDRRWREYSLPHWQRG